MECIYQDEPIASGPRPSNCSHRHLGSLRDISELEVGQCQRRQQRSDVGLLKAGAIA
jgi:hypothetical protein